MLVAPSILSANFLDLGSEVERLREAGADLLHIDVMDGHFVPNLTFGPVVVQDLHARSNLPLDIHLMVEKTEFFIELFSPLNPKFISVHVESCKHLHRIIQSIRNLNISPAVVLNPHTSEKELPYILPDIDMVLVMSVNPGFASQSFLPRTLQKVVNVKNLILEHNPNCLIEVDGGVSDGNVGLLSQRGVDVVVAGSYIFKNKDYKKAIESLKNPNSKEDLSD